MMTKTDFQVTAEAMRSLPIGARVGVYRKLVEVYVKRSEDFDPYRFGKSMGLPTIFCTHRSDINPNTTQKR
jgi:hypothetical protein